jgi:CMP-N-acetylneuraminic acid synthetase
MLSKLGCTDDDSIARVVEAMGVEVVPRPDKLAQDDTPVLEVLKHLMTKLEDVDIIPILQPTSPFLLPDHIDACVRGIQANVNADSAQTVSTFPHNYHAYNQRVVEDGYSRFKFSEERLLFFNKQLKPKHHIFGNLVVTRYSTIVMKNEIFGDKSLAIEIPSNYAFDLDTMDDVAYGEFLIKCGKVDISWLQMPLMATLK